MCVLVILVLGTLATIQCSAGHIDNHTSMHRTLLGTILYVSNGHTTIYMSVMGTLLGTLTITHSCTTHYWAHYYMLAICQ